MKFFLIFFSSSSVTVIFNFSGEVNSVIRGNGQRSTLFLVYYIFVVYWETEDDLEKNSWAWKEGNGMGGLDICRKYGKWKTQLVKFVPLFDCQVCQRGGNCVSSVEGFLIHSTFQSMLCFTLNLALDIYFGCTFFKTFEWITAKMLPKH